MVLIVVIDVRYHVYHRLLVGRRGRRFHCAMVYT
jgi:hypothetical protein